MSPEQNGKLFNNQSILGRVNSITSSPLTGRSIKETPGLEAEDLRSCPWRLGWCWYLWRWGGGGGGEWAGGGRGARWDRDRSARQLWPQSVTDSPPGLTSPTPGSQVSARQEGLPPGIVRTAVQCKYHCKTSPSHFVPLTVWRIKICNTPSWRSSSIKTTIRIRNFHILLLTQLVFWKCRTWHNGANEIISELVWLILSQLGRKIVLKTVLNWPIFSMQKVYTCHVLVIFELCWRYS